MRLEGVSYHRLRQTAFKNARKSMLKMVRCRITHPRSTRMCLGCNEIGVPRLAAAGHSLDLVAICGETSKTEVVESS